MKRLLLLFSFAATIAHAQIDVNTEASLRGISVYDQKIIWVSGSHGALAKTEDGGITWATVKIPGTDSLDFRDVEVLSPTEVVVMSAGLGNKSNVYRTIDAGVTWKSVFANNYPEGFFNGISFSDSKTGVLTGDPIANKLFVLKTKNGGASWKRVNPNKLPMMAENEAGGFAASGSHLYLGDNFFMNGTGGRMARILKANSSFSVWSAIYVPFIQGESSQGIFSLDFCDEKHGVAVGGDYTKENQGSDNVMITEDGGESWVPADNFPVYQSSVRFVSCDQVVSTGPGGTYVSNDGGYTWQKTTYEGYHTLDVAPDGSIWAAGSGGRVMKIIL
ncbi:hypothetical protein [Reichenbachiella sp. MSK19-1]|uniref:WD40/YVTN/BNR-like repeat-containing protein n=1 Tax=Reichenbachiella sp. MSK19-1 TaxID=1897631 RepID=UPI000E6C8671|nr:hypothetical protein [Reichenbachiella sp. MSK19-1]RJE71822.1 hypothetical protein BGP76_06965 [Reichenbachiella sp. MSK19-1]